MLNRRLKALTVWRDKLSNLKDRGQYEEGGGGPQRGVNNCSGRVGSNTFHNTFVIKCTSDSGERIRGAARGTTHGSISPQSLC